MHGSGEANNNKHNARKDQENSCQFNIGIGWSKVGNDDCIGHFGIKPIPRYGSGIDHVISAVNCIPVLHIKCEWAAGIVLKHK